MDGVPQNDSVFVIAEIGINHNGDLDIAKELVSEAASAGVDAVKFQLWDPDEFVSSDEARSEIAQWEFTRDEWRELSSFTDNFEVVFFTSVFDEPSVDFLVELGAPIIKIASGDVTHIPLLEHVSSKNRDVILSTGASNLGEVDRAVSAVRPETAQLHLLECVSAYPAELTDLNLANISTLRDAFDVPVGFSDHTKGTLASAVAVGMGASLVEKHVTLDKEMDGPDHALSLEPDELAELVQHVRAINRGTGDGIKRQLDVEAEFVASARQALKAKRDLPAGTELTDKDVKVARPNKGIQPNHYETVIGRTTREAIPKDAPITWEDI